MVKNVPKFVIFNTFSKMTLDYSYTSLNVSSINRLNIIKSYSHKKYLCAWVLRWGKETVGGPDHNSGPFVRSGCAKTI